MTDEQIAEQLFASIGPPNQGSNANHRQCVDSGLDEDRVNVSLDLTEATYNMSFELLNEQLEPLGVLLKGFAPWEVFQDVFGVFKRRVDMTDLISKGEWDGPEMIETNSGSFMGDGMSFIHLSLMLRGSVLRTQFEAPPLGQSVGDDLLMISVKRKEALKFQESVRLTGGTFSKINSISRDSLTFCENYAVIPSDHSSRVIPYAKGSRFGNLYFLDIIKGSLLTGKSKVKTSGGAPFLGHARMLNQQIQWHPMRWVKERAKAFLWVTNYYHVTKLGSAMASLPRALGGVDLAVGASISIEDEKFRSEFLPYYDSIVQTRDQRVFFAFYTLFQGIFKAEPKGFPYENDSQVVLDIMSKIELYNGGKDLTALLPVFMHEEPVTKKLNYLGKKLNLVSIGWLIDEISRRTAFKNFWEQNRSKSYMTLPLKEPARRWKAVWSEVRRNFDPPAYPIEYASIAHLASSFEARVWNIYFNKEDPAIQAALGGCPSLYLSFGSERIL
jgi:hypothetical protein